MFSTMDERDREYLLSAIADIKEGKYKYLGIDHNEPFHCDPEKNKLYGINELCRMVAELDAQAQAQAETQTEAMNSRCSSGMKKIN